MPIKPENRARYPTNWRAIRADILTRAQHKCEFCALPNYAVGRRKEDGRFVIAAGSAYYDQLQYTASFREASAAARELNEWAENEKFIVIVLTIAHLDNTPENCDPANLRALCQRCHLVYDQTHHQVNAYATRRRGKSVADLFEESSCLQ